jgi:hypothetical protein
MKDVEFRARIKKEGTAMQCEVECETKARDLIEVLMSEGEVLRNTLASLEVQLTKSNLRNGQAAEEMPRMVVNYRQH